MKKSKNTKGLVGSNTYVDIDELTTLRADKKALKRELEEAREGLNIDIGDFIMVDDEVRFVTSVISDPVLRVYFYIDDVEHVAFGCDIDCHFLNMNRYNEQLKEKG